MTTPVAYIRTPFKEKFSVPRQPGLAPAAKGEILFTAEFDSADHVRGLEQFSHIWLLFEFHQTKDKVAKALVRPPRLGGNQKIGVFASRSTHRPNSLGLSVVKLEQVIIKPGAPVSIIVSGVDLVDGTPILDIKPYLPYSDAVSEASAGFAQQPPPDKLDVVFTAEVLHELNKNSSAVTIKQVIEQVLQQDPRPAYQNAESNDRVYGVKLFNYDVKWRVKNKQCVIEDLVLLDNR